MKTPVVCPRCGRHIQARYVPTGLGRLGVTECDCPAEVEIDDELTHAHMAALRWYELASGAGS